ncbi:MAG TPA: antitoxin VapB family protein [Candidatus Nanoarchaeia archaeon]|nr:antitoxin VapB family protein [Candidatus Nanoarchaeia archaeon]
MVKTITVKEDAYKTLLLNKMADESFSELIRRIFSKKDIMDFAGSWKKISEKRADEAKKEILSQRKKSTKELLKNDMY